MTQEELIKHLHEALNSVDITFPYRYVLVEAIEALSQPSLPEGLEEAAVAYSKQVSDGHNYRDLTCGFIAGAEWQEKQTPLPEDTTIFQKGVAEGKKLHDIVSAELGKYNGDDYWKAPWAIDSTGLQYPLYLANLGAEWQKAKMLEDAVEIKVKEDAGGFPIVPLDAIELYDYENDKPLAKAGDKVKVIVIKED